MACPRLSLLLSLFVSAGPAALAAGLSVTTTVRSASPKAFVADVRVAGATVIRLRGADHNAVQARASLLADRLADLALAGIRPVDIRVVGGRQPALRVRDQTLIAVDREVARASASSPAALAASWAKLLKAAFAQPYLAVAPARLTVPYLETRTIRVGGTLAGAAQLALYSPDTVEPQANPGGDLIAVRGVGVGATILGISRGDQQAMVPIEVRKWAAVIGPPEPVLISGPPPPLAVLSRLALNAALVGTRLEPNAQLTAAVAPEAPPASGYRVALRAVGQDYLSVAKALRVQQDGMPPPTQPPAVLLVSNEPENIAGLGDLFVGTLEPRSAARLLYHHKCVMPGGCQLRLELSNVSAQTAAVHMVSGVAGPHRDELFVGHLAARRFRDHDGAGAGYVLYVPPGRTWSALSWRLGRQDVVSGLLRLTSLNDASVRVCLTACPPQATSPTYPDEVSPQRLTTAQTPATRFPPLKRLSAGYAVGDAWLFLHLGKEGSADDQGGLLYGDYGVVYEIELKLANGTPQPRKIEIALRAGGGAARGIFVIDHRAVETGVLYPGQEELLHTLMLAPGEQRTLPIQTMPESASSYPVTLAVRSR